ncbi:MAG: hypothetical protein ACI94Y_002139 [Maribacter sp.]|jgi:hypothetical protein
MIMHYQLIQAKHIRFLFNGHPAECSVIVKTLITESTFP